MTELEERVRELEAELAAASREGGLERLAALLGTLGSNLDAIGQRERGLEVLEKALALHEELGDARGAAETLNRLGSMLTRDRPAEARGYVERALENARAVGDLSEEATALNNLAILDESAGSLDLARERYARSIALLRATDERQKLATTLSNLGVVLEKCQLDDEAWASWQEALAIHEDVGHRPGVASTLNNMGSLLERRGDPQGAIVLYRDALAIQETVGDVGEIIIFLGNRAHAHLALGQRTEAVELWRRKLACQERIGDRRGSAATLHALAEALDVDRGHEEVFECYARALDALAGLGTCAELAEVEMGFARARSDAGNDAKALALGEHSLAVRVELGDEVAVSAAMDNLGLLYAAAGDHTRALELMESSLELAEQAGDHEGMEIVLCNLGQVCDEAGLGPKAAGYYERALPFVERSGDVDALASLLEDLGLSHHRLGNDELAMGYTRRALATYERCGSEGAARLRRRIEELEGQCDAGGG